MSCSEIRQRYHRAFNPVQPHSPSPLSCANSLFCYQAEQEGDAAEIPNIPSLGGGRAEVHRVGRAVKPPDTSCMQSSSIPGMAAQQLSQINNKRHKRQTEIREIKAKTTREIGRFFFFWLIFVGIFQVSTMLWSNLLLLWMLWILRKN